jgi:hypothetical protein
MSVVTVPIKSTVKFTLASLTIDGVLMDLAAPGVTVSCLLRQDQTEDEIEISTTIVAGAAVANVPKTQFLTARLWFRRWRYQNIGAGIDVRTVNLIKFWTE